MSDANAFAFGKFIPGFEFLQQLASAQKAGGAMPGLGQWVAPTVSLDELDKRISELKAVLFWLDQNATALKATIQALEVQKMTLATLQGMNVSMSEVAKAFTITRETLDARALWSQIDALDGKVPESVQVDALQVIWNLQRSFTRWLLNRPGAIPDIATAVARYHDGYNDIRAAEDAVGQADLLQKAIAKLGTDLGKAETDAAALIADIEHDIATASGLPDTDGRLAGVIATTRGQVDAAKAQLTGPAKQPIAALQSLDAANAQIDATLAGVRDAQAQAQRAAQQLNALMTQAQAQVSAAEDFITSRRGAIGAQARTRLAEAGASLVQARQLQQTDPAAALPYAQRANDLAAQATQAAQADVGAFSGGGMFGGGSGGGGGNMMGAVLGGILINSLLGGGRGGGYGGGYGGGSRGGYGGGSRGGGMGPGSFGGGGTRSRRGGGRF